MPRPLRRQVAGGIYHLFDRGNRRQRIVLDDEDRAHYLALLERVAAPRGWSVLAWCLMDNHYHLLVRTPAADLAAGMQHLNGEFASWFNRRHATVGHLWHGRYGDRLVLDEAHLHWEMHYIARNPVKARMVAAAEDYAWSSAGVVLHGLASPLLDREALLRLLSPFDDNALHKYRHIVLHGRAPIPPETPHHLAAGGHATAPADETDPPPPTSKRGLTPLLVGGGDDVAVELLRAIAGHGRLDVLAAIAGGSRHQRVIADATGRSQQTVSQHLAGLARAGLLRSERDGRCLVYELVPEALAAVEGCLRELRGAAAGRRPESSSTSTDHPATGSSSTTSSSEDGT
jgi:REP element-mobilizing transposase RayT/DNA-binding MarR family transcriptional regulator